jgi:hypothetical protein
MIPGKPGQLSQSKELEYWVGRGLDEWDLHLQQYMKVFRFDVLNYSHVRILDVGSGPISVFERVAPPGAQIHPYDSLAQDYNRIAAEKKFRILDRIPAAKYQLITLFNCLDHMEDPAELLAALRQHLDEHGELWIYCHLDQPYSPDEHPQKFRFWQIIALIARYYDIKECGVAREGRLFPYAWWGVCGANRGKRPILRTAVFIVRCGGTYSRFHAKRAAIKLLKTLGLRRLLPPDLRF